MSFSQRVIRYTKRFIDTYQKSQVLRVLLELSDAQLKDIGVSRYQLERGLSAYPWRDADLLANTERPSDVLQFQRRGDSATTATGHAPLQQQAA